MSLENKQRIQQNLPAGHELWLDPVSGVAEPMLPVSKQAQEILSGLGLRQVKPTEIESLSYKYNPKTKQTILDGSALPDTQALMNPKRRQDIQGLVPATPEQTEKWLKSYGSYNTNKLK